MKVLRTALIKCHNKYNSQLLCKNSTETPLTSGLTEKRILFLHGLMGRKEEWKPTSRLLLERNPLFTSVLWNHRWLDTVNQPVIQRVNTVLDIANEICRQIELAKCFPPSIICGHSVSGKVALQILTLLENAQLPVPSDVWVLDYTPGKEDQPIQAIDHLKQKYPDHFLSLLRDLDILVSLPLVFESKHHIRRALFEAGVSKPTVEQWLGRHMTAVAVDGSKSAGFRFAIDLPAVRAVLVDAAGLDMWRSVERHRGRSALHFVRAGGNTHWTYGAGRAAWERLADIAAGAAAVEAVTNKSRKCVQVHVMEGVGHRLHVEDPEALVELICRHSDIH